MTSYENILVLVGLFFSGLAVLAFSMQNFKMAKQIKSLESLIKSKNQRLKEVEEQPSPAAYKEVVKRLKSGQSVERVYIETKVSKADVQAIADIMS